MKLNKYIKKALGILLAGGLLIFAHSSSYATNIPYMGLVPILDEPSTTIEEMQDWSSFMGGTDLFTSLAPTFYQIATEYGVDPAVAYAQSAKETNFMKFTGIVPIGYYNTCGMKTTVGGADNDPANYQKFISWEAGITAQVQHLALYGGHEDFPLTNPGTLLDPRHFTGLYGLARYVEQLGGNWAPSRTYGQDIVSWMEQFSDVEKAGYERIGGANRYETSKLIMDQVIIDNTTVVLASGEKFADALLANSVAKQLNGKVYLTYPNSIPESVQKAIADTKPEKIYLLGGTTSIDHAVQDQLEKDGYIVQRLAGNSRFDTACVVAQELYPDATSAILVNGMQFPDALTISPYATENNVPVLMTDGSTLIGDTEGLLRKMNHIIIIGGDEAVSSQLETRFQDWGKTTERIAGLNRYTTALEIAKKYYPAANHILFADGRNFPDTLSGVSLANQYHAPILLVDGDALLEEQIQYMDSLYLYHTFILGGPSAVTPLMEQSISNALQ